jgi:glycosyltransferase involved in cell wall biosynthesis
MRIENKISLITPAYNSEVFVKEGVESIKNQTLNQRYFEWIILDDGSFDNTFDELKKHTSKLENVQIFSRSKNKGTSITRQQAIELSNGKYLAFFDIDDLLEKNALESTWNLMESNPGIKFSYSKHKRIDEKNNFICDREGYNFSRKRLLHYNFVGHLKCIDREIHEKINGFDEAFSRYSEDYDYVLRASEILEDDQIIQNPEFLYKYRIHSNNNMSNIEMMKKNACMAIKNSLKRKEKISADVFWNHKTDDLYNFYDWKNSK